VSESSGIESRDWIFEMDWTWDLGIGMIDLIKLKVGFQKKNNKL